MVGCCGDGEVVRGGWLGVRTGCGGGFELVPHPVAVWMMWASAGCREGE